MTEVKMSFDRGDKAPISLDVKETNIKTQLKKTAKKNVLKDVETVNKNYGRKEQSEVSHKRKRCRVIENCTDRRLKKQCETVRESDSCGLLVNADPQSLPNTYSKISAWWHLPLNPIQLATTGILKSGLDQISWVPLIGLLEDLAINGTVAKKKVLECATEVLVKVLGEDLVDQVLLQFHKDPCKAKIVIVESLIMWYVQELAQKKVQAIQMDREFSTKSHEVVSVPGEKKGCQKKERQLPSYQKMTESFKRKQRSKRLDYVPSKMFNNRVTTGKENKRTNTRKKSNLNIKEADESLSTTNASSNSLLSHTTKEVLNQNSANDNVNDLGGSNTDEKSVQVGSGDCQILDNVTHSRPKTKSNNRETINKKKTSEKDWDVIETAMETYVAERDTVPLKISPLEKSNTSLTEDIMRNDIVKESDDTFKNFNKNLSNKEDDDNPRSHTRSDLSLISPSAPDTYYTSETCPKIIQVNSGVADDIQTIVPIEPAPLKPERDENPSKKKCDLNKPSSLENDTLLLLSHGVQVNISGISESGPVTSSESEIPSTSSGNEFSCNDITTTNHDDVKIESIKSQLCCNQQLEAYDEPNESVTDQNIIESISDDDDQIEDPTASFSSFHSVLQPVVTDAEKLNMDSAHTNDSRVALKLSDELMIILKEQFVMKNRLSNIPSVPRSPQSENAVNISSMESRPSDSAIMRKLNFISVLSMMVLTWSILTTIHFSMEDLKIWPSESITTSINWLINGWYR